MVQVAKSIGAGKLMGMAMHQTAYVLLVTAGAPGARSDSRTQFCHLQFRRRARRYVSLPISTAPQGREAPLTTSMAPDTGSLQELKMIFQVPAMFAEGVGDTTPGARARNEGVPSATDLYSLPAASFNTENSCFLGAACGPSLCVKEPRLFKRNLKCSHAYCQTTLRMTIALHT